MNSLTIPEESIGNDNSENNEVKIVVSIPDDVVTTFDDVISISSEDTDDVTPADDVILINNDFVIENLTKEDLGLDENEADDIYEGLIKDFRTKLDSLSFRRLDRSGIKAQAESFRAIKENDSVLGRRKGREKVSKTLMLPAVQFQELDEDESYRRDTGSSTVRSRASSGASGASSAGKYSRRYQGNAQFGRKKSVMGALMKRGRTMRKTLRALHINEADHQEVDGFGSVPPSNEQRLRQFVLKEIFDTETEYMKLLEFMVEVMTPSIKKLADDPTRAHSCKKETTSQILSNVKEIHSLHVEFHKVLEEAVSPLPHHSHCIGNVFLQFKDKFHIYDEYCANFSRAQKICYELESDPDFHQLIQEWKTSVESQSRRFLHLEGFVISPVQRLCKYPLFLKELKKHTSARHKDYDDVIEAQKVMEGVTKSVNESERRQLMIQAITDMENMCDSWEQSGLVAKQGFLTKRGGSVKSWYIRWFLLRGHQLAYYKEPTDVHPLGVLDLTSYKSLQPDASHIGRPFAFSIKMPDRSYYLYATTEQEKEEWVNILQWKFECIDRSRRQAHRPFETVVFSSLSSFLHPKSQQQESADEDDQPAILETGCDVINTGLTILTPTGEDEDVFSDSGDSSKSNSPGPRPQSVSFSPEAKATSPLANGSKRSSSERRTKVTKKIQKSPSRVKRISSFFQTNKKSPQRINSS